MVILYHNIGASVLLFFRNFIAFFRILRSARIYAPPSRGRVLPRAARGAAPKARLGQPPSGRLMAPGGRLVPRFARPFRACGAGPAPFGRGAFDEVCADFIPLLTALRAVAAPARSISAPSARRF